MVKFLKSHIAKELYITFAFVTVYYIGVRIPLPYLNTNEFYSISQQFRDFDFINEIEGQFSIFSLGLMPYVSSYILVEIGSLFIPFLKKHRKGDNKGRAILKAYALFVTLILGTIQSKFIISGLEQLVFPSGGAILTITNHFQYALIITIHVSCVFLLILLAELVTLFGIGNGISLLILSGICIEATENLNTFFNFYNNTNINAFHISILSGIIFFSFIFVPILLLRTSTEVILKHKLLDHKTNYFKILSCPSGKIAIGYATSLVALPVTLFSFFGKYDSLNNFFSYGSLSYNITVVSFVFFFSYLFAWLFFYPEKRLQKLQNWGWQTIDDQQQVIQKIKRKLAILNLPWTFFLCLLVIIPSIIFSSFDVPFYLGDSSVFIIGVLSLDIFSRINLWRQIGDEKLFKIAEFHDVYFATMIKNHLKSEGIKFYLQGYYHRHLLFFFGPYIAINLKVAKSDIGRANEIIQDFYNSLGLLKVET